VRAKDVQIIKLHRAVCKRPGCGWAGSLQNSYQDANTERLQHMASHTRADAMPP
jgi:hypothetical protein